LQLGWLKLEISPRILPTARLKIIDELVQQKGHRLFGMDQFMIGRWECSFELSCLMNSLVMIFIAFSEMIVEM